MARVGVFRHFQSLGGVLIAGTLVVAAVPAPASAQGFFDLFFGGFRRSAPPSAPTQRSFADPRHDGRSDDLQRDSGGGGPGVAYCVRLCDGRHFPINYNSVSAAETCRAFCPAASTQIFHGSGISFSVAPNGKRYSDLPNAFVYRDKIVDGCTCDGKSPTGLARQDIEDDATLRPGDIVATGNGLMAYRGGNTRATQFSTISNTPGLSPAMRRQLTATKVATGGSAEDIPDPEADGETPVMSRNVNQRSQAAR